MTTNYFAYGINMDGGHLRSFCPNAHALGTAALHGWRFAINRQGWATVVPSSESIVHGVLWLVGERCLRRLDRFEEVGEGLYRREQAIVSADGEEVSADLYIASESEPGRPDQAYINSIIAAARASGAPEPYLSELAGWSTR